MTSSSKPFELLVPLFKKEPVPSLGNNGEKLAEKFAYKHVYEITSDLARENEGGVIDKTINAYLDVSELSNIPLKVKVMRAMVGI